MDQDDSIDALRARISQLEGSLAAAIAERDAESALLTATFDAMAEAVIVIDSAWRVRFNPSARHMFGVPSNGPSMPDEWGARVFQADGVTEIPLEDQPIVRALSRGESTIDVQQYVELPHHKSGEGLWVRGTTRALKGADGSIRGAVSVIRDIGEERRRKQELHDQAQLLEATFNAMSEGVIIAGRDGKLRAYNPAAQRILAEVEPGIGMTDRINRQGLFHADGHTRFDQGELPISRALKGDTVTDVEMIVRNEAHPEGIAIEVSGNPIVNEQGVIVGAVAAFRDVGERKRWEQELAAQLIRERERNEVLEQLQNAVQELSAPILEVWDDVLALPVIGLVDEIRSADMMERLLKAITNKQSRFVILDITGVEVVDTATADRFIKLVRAVELLGSRCVLTGTRAAVAQTLVSLGVDLGPLTTLRTFKHGLKECLRAMAADIERARLSAARSDAASLTTTTSTPQSIRAPG